MEPIPSNPSSTIGLGDIIPTKPGYLVILFIFIIIGLSLVSMCINLIQSKLEKTYERGNSSLYGERAGGIYLEVSGEGGQKAYQRRGSTLGMILTPLDEMENRE